MSAIKQPQPLDATPETIGLARENCAARYRGKGQASEAEAFALGLRDWSWPMRYEVQRLVAEQGGVL